jgi:hypothetical protein
VKAFNQEPEKFDLDEYMSSMDKKWKEGCGIGFVE